MSVVEPVGEPVVEPVVLPVEPVELLPVVPAELPLPEPVDPLVLEPVDPVSEEPLDLEDALLPLPEAFDAEPSEVLLHAPSEKPRRAAALKATAVLV